MKDVGEIIVKGPPEAIQELRRREQLLSVLASHLVNEHPDELAEVVHRTSDPDWTAAAFARSIAAAGLLDVEV